MDTCLQIKRKQRNRQPRFYNKRFFDKECKEAKRLMRKYNSLLSKNPFNREFNTLYFQYLKKYKKTMRKKKHDYENKLISQLESLANQDPKKYWEFVDTLKESVKRNASSTISDSEWNDHFRNLLNRKHESSSHYVNRINTKIKKLAEIKCFNELDYAITNKEILHCIKLLKNSKSAGLDSIINEVLKAIGEEILPVLNKLFNFIYNSGYYPSGWRKALIVPIYKKKGDVDDSNYYRGIALISCLGKLFNNILNERLTNFLRKNQILSEYQIGFSKKASENSWSYVCSTSFNWHTHETK